ncbi:MAG: PspC domain-containing protein, partial [Bacteroidales bacterium]|nr:PspC domain-containing protein [Bacteroidales bacterium]
MKKNFTVNISGLLFHIDEDAFEALNLYLSRLKAHFTGTPGREEIIADIENRLAEMLQERSVGNAGIISLEIVKEVTSLMGDPTEFADGAGEADTGNNAEIKRIFREPEDKYLGGVCGGLGAYFNIDPLWFRVAFVVLTLIGGSGILIYAVLWIAVPRARTTSDRLRMRGESVNISNIERSIREELNG